MMKIIPSKKIYNGKEYKFGGAFWYKPDAEQRAKNLSTDTMGRRFMTIHIVKYNSDKYMLPPTLGEVIPEARRMGLGRYGIVTNSIYVIYVKHYRDW